MPSTITFTSTDAGTYGNFLDDVVVVAGVNTDPHVSLPESNSLAMLLIGLAGWGFVRRRKNLA